MTLRPVHLTPPLAQTIALLRRTPAALDALLRDLPDSWTRTNEGGASWNVCDIVSHLAHCDRTNFMSRTRTILHFGDTRPFDPFDRRGHEQEAQGKSLAQLLDEFTLVRAESLDELQGMNLTPQDLERCGLHRRFGAMPMSVVLSTWAVHDLTHLHQISRLMAHQYRDAVGPLHPFLGVLHCEGHSASA